MHKSKKKSVSLQANSCCYETVLQEKKYHRIPAFVCETTDVAHHAQDDSHHDHPRVTTVLVDLRYRSLWRRRTLRPFIEG